MPAMDILKLPANKKSQSADLQLMFAGWWYSGGNHSYN
jgi:hypothetical protein